MPMGPGQRRTWKMGFRSSAPPQPKPPHCCFISRKPGAFHIWCLLTKYKIIIVLKSIAPKGYSIKMFVGYPRPSFPGRYLPTSLYLISFCRSLSGPLCPLMPDCSLFLTITHTHTLLFPTSMLFPLSLLPPVWPTRAPPTHQATINSNMASMLPPFYLLSYFQTAWIYLLTYIFISSVWTVNLDLER